MKIRYSAVATAILAAVCATSVAQAEGMQNNTQGGVTNNSGAKDAMDTNRKLNAPNVKDTTVGSGATTTNSGRTSPDEQDTSRGKGPSTAAPPVGSR